MKPQGCLQTGWIITRIALSICVAALFAVTASGTLAGLAFTATVTAPKNASLVVQQPGILVQSRTLFANLLVQQVENKYQSIPLLSQVPSATMQSLAEDMFSDSWVEDAISTTVLGVESWLQSDSQPLPQVAYDLTPLKDYLKTEQGTQIIQQLIQAIPVCMGDFSLLDLLNLGNLTCIPNGVSLTLFTPILANSIANLIPNQITLEELYQSGAFSQADSATLMKVRNDYQSIKTWTHAGLWVSIILLVIYLLLQLPSFRRLLRALPWIFDAAGLLTLLLVAGIRIFFQPLIAWGSAVVFAGMNSAWQLFIPGLAETVATQAGLICALGAVALLVVGIFFHLGNILERALVRH